MAKFSALAAAGALLAALVAPHAGAQANPPENQPCEKRPAPPRTPETVQTVYLNHVLQQNDLNDISTALRNALPKAKIFAVQAQNALTIIATPEDLASAQKLVADLDKPRKLYRLTFTITSLENGKRTGSEQYVLLALAGMKATLKQGRRVPIVTGTAENQASAQGAQVQYMDIGLSIESSVTGSPDDLMLHAKIEQSSLAGENSARAPADPMVQQTVFEGFPGLVQGKSLVLGSLDIPGTTRRQEIAVVAEVVR